MRYINYIGIGIFGLASLFACQRETVMPEGYGYLTAAVTRDNSIIDVTTKADEIQIRRLPLSWRYTMGLNWFRQLMTTRL